MRNSVLSLAISWVKIVVLWSFIEIGFLGNHNGQGCQTTLKDKKLEICSQLEYVCVCVCRWYNYLQKWGVISHFNYKNGLSSSALLTCHVVTTSVSLCL